ncbi:DUF917 domain-containing protein [Ktedonosporobacter rubrisoli]|uniref:DUF917 domain-containing protein n=1 Tax=Ktedonosporobacter rubrisoli TaxID=2509675 RepID=A0A4P6K0H9_KTERU|nr:DUF917 domain-containing protein [Ktedonosporobacter rubrisoli]QBD81282.1 DUF917 domain-containing protein [Ktedonosporobacter rubrisoli]
MRQITAEDLEYLAVGAAILGTGGGGDPFIGKLMAQQAIAEEGPVTLLDPHEIADDAFILPAAMMGAPTVMIEKIPEGREIVRALRAEERRLGRKADIITPIECGGLNSQIPFILAARTHLPVLDGDGMGRAFPELQMITFHIHGLSSSPAVLADERGSLITLETPDDFELEWQARGITIRMGGQAHIISTPLSGADYKRAAVFGTVSMGIKIGQAVLSAHSRGMHPVEAICEATQQTASGRAIVLFKGKVSDVERRTRAGFAMGRATIQGLGEYRESQLSIEFQNENLVAMRDGEVLASVPDLICLLDSEVGTAITTERLRYGQRVVAIGIPCAEIMRSEAALAVWGPKVFGYDIPFIPLEQRFKDYYRKYGVAGDKEKYLTA